MVFDTGQHKKTTLSNSDYLAVIRLDTGYLLQVYSAVGLNLVIFVDQIAIRTDGCAS